MNHLNDLVNLQIYPPLELVFFACGAYCWVIVYISFAVNIYRKKFIEMPVFAATGNIAWEFIFSFLFPTDMGTVFEIAYKIWFFLSLIIIYAVFKYGWKQFSFTFKKWQFNILYILSILFWLFFHFTFVKSGLEVPSGAHTGYILNLVISSTYILLYLKHSRPTDFSKVAAWFKMLGTLGISIGVYLHYPNKTFLHFLGLMCFFLDTGYLFLFYSKKIQNAT